MYSFILQLFLHHVDETAINCTASVSFPASLDIRNARFTPRR
uniref:Uncharacterized protein n=1 Tax=uncultured bacterium A1Q1_fos_2111 TaxID=1256563 RepID=L7W275_9BACT|nr:hypothetical protein [uncultured bacterium A1Q1_fos_2111]